MTSGKGGRWTSEWTVADMGARKVEPSGVDTHERGGALLIVGDAQALAEGTAGVEPAGEAEKATAAKPEALVPWAQSVAKREVEILPGEGKHVHEPPPEVLPQKGKHEIKTPSTGESERTEVLPQGEGMLEVPAQEHRRKPEVLPPNGEREHGTTPQGCPNEGNCKPSCRGTKSSCPLGRDQAPGILEGSRQGSKSSSRKTC